MFKCTSNGKTEEQPKENSIESQNHAYCRQTSHRALPVIDTFNHTSPDESLLLLATVPFPPSKGKKKRTAS
jgi:hypothetical protein